MSSVRDLWPASSLSVRAGGLELRWMDDDLLSQIADVAGRGIHDESAMPFNVPWTRGSAEEVARRVLAFQWAARPQVGPQRLVLELGVLADDVPVGVQGASGDDWSVLRQVETGSWLGREHQGRGIGLRMRALILHLLFEGLGADYVTSSAFQDNAASNAVSRRVGYEEDGSLRVVREGAAMMQLRYRMSRDRWITLREHHAEILGAPVSMSGTEDVLAQLVKKDP
jgi:RimJ/RimL family protein N-acetyltransferase